MPKVLPKYCPVCKIKFQPNSGRQKYCSKKCKAIRAKERTFGLTEFFCAWCGDAFLYPRKKKYCCKECYLQANGRGSKKQKTKDSSYKPLIEGSLAYVNQLARDAGLSYGRYTGQIYAQKFARLERPTNEKKNILH